MNTDRRVMKKAFNNRRCVIIGCNSSSLKHPSLKFFRFPIPGTRDYQIWISACKQSANQIRALKKPLVCSLHFLTEDIGGRRLNNNAFPKLRLTPPEEFAELQERDEKLTLLNQIMMEWLVRNRPYRDIYGKLLIEMASIVQSVISIKGYTPDKDWLRRFNELMVAPNSRLFKKNDITCGASLHITDVIQDIMRLDKHEQVPSRHTSVEDSIEISDDDDDYDEDFSEGSVDISNKLEVHMTVDEDKSFSEPSPKLPRLQSISLDYEDEAKEQQTAIETYKQALAYLKPLEDFALVKEDFRAIGLLTQLEAIFAQSQ